ncbi:MAG: class I SAM-dependent methyltransferase [Actinocatenispora sp.]
MTAEKVSWEKVWHAADGSSRQYGNGRHRFNRALDKIGYFIQSEISFKGGFRVLEAGCGNGAILQGLLDTFAVEGYGVDISENARDQAEKLMKQTGRSFAFSVRDVRDLEYEDNFFDLAISLGVIEHMQNPEVAVREMARVLKPDGTAIIMTPNQLAFGFVDRLLKQSVGRWPFGYQTEYTPHALSALVSSCGLHVMKEEALPRRRLSTDSGSLRTVSKLDQVVNSMLSTWGFYSYVFARKPRHVITGASNADRSGR